ncbi:hypothetical protein [Sphingomonas quercus]|uniref:Uncharacterized protein n=1 Tax=Sphingomonas quercus TaxID=2842451 RepID=A0ABS6BJL7_9SPHN|nr:hypothetical protein [Sphingomonas quercus]MBU3077424.1 hypothetical protein [Sphingomonas quercus]
MTLLRRIEIFIATTGVPATRIGREAVGDPRLVRDIRNGRQIGPAVAARLDAYLSTESTGARA